MVPFERGQVMDICKGDKEIAKSFSLLLDFIEQLENEVKELKRQLNSNSKNSSKPPSSDGYRKLKSLRQTNGKLGAPPGHKGNNLHFIDTPDYIITHEIKTCCDCQRPLDDITPTYNARQVYDLPEIKLEVTEHRVESKICPDCGQVNRADYPNGVNAHTQYGERVKAYVTYMNVQHHMPLDRLQEMTNDLMGHDISQTTILNHLDTMYDKSLEIEESIKEDLLGSPCIHGDESSLRVGAETYWVHSASDSRSTLYGVNKSRGSSAIDEIGLLPAYTGVLSHDCYSMYFQSKYSFEHALCGVHLLRDCQGIIDHDKQKWPVEMKSVLNDIRIEGKLAKHTDKPVTPDKIEKLSIRYDDIIKAGREETTHLVPIKAAVDGEKRKKGKPAQPKSVNLLNRFEKHKAAIFISLHNNHVPFDNNQAERDIRMVKVKQNVSGSFRTEDGAKIFARIRGVVSTCRKRGLNILETLTAISKGEFIL